MNILKHIFLIFIFHIYFNCCSLSTGILVSVTRYSAADDKPQAKISPLPSSPGHSQHLTRVPDLEQSRDEYVDLLKMKYGI